MQVGGGVGRGGRNSRPVPHRAISRVTIKAPVFLTQFLRQNSGREEEEGAACVTHARVCLHAPSSVSSVLNRDVKQFGKQHMFDANEETCWNSDQGARQWVALDFPHTVKVSQLHIQFQGGFSSRLCTLEGEELLLGQLVKISELYPEDVNAMQISFLPLEVFRLKITFENSTDFFGRIVVYHLRVLGERL
uniref:Nuclear receptor 2C2-associated protein n=1 Tax=Anas platyrhynchos platyrhynchos TaxID=8840 RepID=U3JA17_ANAPP